MAFTPADISAPHEAENTLKLLLNATTTGNHEAFLRPGTERFQKGISKAMFDSVSKQVASRLKEGYTADFLTELKQGNFLTYLWKISFRDGGDEYIARLALDTNGKVAGFLLN